MLRWHDPEQALISEIPERLATILVSRGLPIWLDEALGIQFETPCLHQVSGRGRSTRRILDVGREIWDGDTLRLGIDLESRAFVGYGNRPTDEVFINSSLDQFLEFVCLYRPVAEKLSRDIPPVRVVSMEELRQKAEAVRQGLAKPNQSRKSTVTPASAVAELRDQMKTIDDNALRPRTWWTRVLRQLRDGLV